MFNSYVKLPQGSYSLVVKHGNGKTQHAFSSMNHSDTFSKGFSSAPRLITGGQVHESPLPFHSHVLCHLHESPFMMYSSIHLFFHFLKPILNMRICLYIALKCPETICLKKW